MKMKKVSDVDEALRLIEQFQTKSTLSNCYLMASELEKLVSAESLWYQSDGLNLFFLENKGNCYRVHYLLNDLGSNFESSVDMPLMLEILYKDKDGEPEDVVKYWGRHGFKRNLLRNNLSAKYSDIRLSANQSHADIRFAEGKKEGEFAQALFNNVFDPYSGDYLTSEDAEMLLDNRQILIAANGKNFCGALHFYRVGKCAWIGHVAVDSDARGSGFGSALVSEFIRLNHDDEKSRYALWVQSQNKSAVAMYDRFGFKSTGKSSLSMIKTD